MTISVAPLTFADGGFPPEAQQLLQILHSLGRGDRCLIFCEMKRALVFKERCMIDHWWLNWWWIMDGWILMNWMNWCHWWWACSLSHLPQWWLGKFSGTNWQTCHNDSTHAIGTQWLPRFKQKQHSCDCSLRKIVVWGSCEILANDLMQYHGVPAVRIHGDMAQYERSAALEVQMGRTRWCGWGEWQHVVASSYSCSRL